MTWSSRLTVPSGSGAGDRLWAVGFQSKGPRSRTPSPLRSNRSRWIWIGWLCVVVLLPHPSLPRSLSGLWQGVGEAASGRVGAGFNGTLWCALIAHRASSPGSPRFSNSRRPHRPLAWSEHPKFPPVALGRPRYLSSWPPLLASFSLTDTLGSTLGLCSCSTRVATWCRHYRPLELR